MTDGSYHHLHGGEGVEPRDQLGPASPLWGQQAQSAQALGKVLQQEGEEGGGRRTRRGGQGMRR